MSLTGGWCSLGRRLNSEQSSTSPSLARQQTIDGWIPDQLLVVYRAWRFMMGDSGPDPDGFSFGPSVSSFNTYRPRL